MQAELDKNHAEMLLKTNSIGRLGCASQNRPYIVPVSYVYDDGYIYGHTNDGQKLKMMRDNPHVCFEVDEIDDFRRWRSVICWGRFEELEGDEMAKALNLMIERLTPFPAEAPGVDDDASPIDEVAHHIKLRSRKGATYRIHVDEMTGRFERP